MIDSVQIDTDYKKAFNIVESDIPIRKSDLVQGSYEIEIPKKKCTIAIKITDMLGEEVLRTKTI